MKLNYKHGLLALSALSILPFAWADKGTAQVSVVRGSAALKSADGSLQQVASVPAGQWVHASKSGATVQVGDAVVRVSPNTQFKVSKSNDGLSVDAKSGTLYVKLAEDQKTQLRVAGSVVKASRGEFLVDSDEKAGLFVLSGDAQVSGGQNRSSELVGLMLDGPNTTNTTTPSGTQNQRTNTNNAREDQPPSNTNTNTNTSTTNTTRTNTNTNTNTNTRTNTNTNTANTGGGGTAGDMTPLFAGLGAGALGLGLWAGGVFDGDDEFVGPVGPVFPPNQIIQNDITFVTTF